MTRAEVGLRRRELDLTATVAAFDARSWHGPVHGTVPVIDGYVLVDESGEPVGVTAELDLAGLDTGNQRRDRDLRGKRFFRTDHHPSMHFDADIVVGTPDGWEVTGVLGIAGTACPLTLQVRRNDQQDVQDSFTATVDLDPRDLGVKAPRFLVRSPVTLTIRTRLG